MSTTADHPLVRVAEAFSDLLGQTTRMTVDVLQSVGDATGALSRGFGVAPRRAAMGGCGCTIPPPCWMPRALGDVVSHVCPGGRTTVRLRVTNCGATASTVGVQASVKTTGFRVDPPTLTLGSMESGVVVASFDAPAADATGTEYEALVWVRGCHEHFLRWTIRTSSRGVDACHEVDLEDCPDLIHHWYDHFYCHHPCTHPRSGTVRG